MKELYTYHFYFVWKDEESGIVKAQKVILTYAFTSEPIACVDSINLVFPEAKENAKVVVSYGRTVTDGDLHIDKRYDCVYKDGLPELFLGLEGKVKFKSDVPSFSRVNLSSFQMKLIGKGMAIYSIQDRDRVIQSSFKQESDGFSISLLDIDWKCAIPAERCTYKQDVDFLMTTEFYLSDGSSGDIRIMSNTDRRTQGNLYKAKQIYMIWGCIAEGSMIRLADGSEKPIESIAAGDVLMLADGQIGIVDNIWEGDEEVLCCVESKKGKLMLSETHPLMTGRGIIRAGELNMADKLVDFANEMVELTGLYPQIANKVYNMDVSVAKEDSTSYGEEDEGVLLICDGFLVGDNRMQNNMPDEDSLKDSRVTWECAMKNRFFEAGCW